MILFLKLMVLFNGLSSGTKSVTYKSEYLKDTEISKFDKATGTQATLAANSKYVQIECVVKSSIGANLKNVAEIATDNLNDIETATSSINNVK